MKRWKIVLLILLLVLLAVGGGFTLWASAALGPGEQALAALQSDMQVEVTQQSGQIIFSPRDVQPTTGLVFYPGGRVDYRSYAPLLKPIAAQGFQVILVRVPLNLAVFNPDAADQVIQNNPAISIWAVGGHSLGGAMAASYAYKHPTIRGLVFWAAYPASSSSLADRNLSVLSIYASQDGLATAAKRDAARGLLPSTTQYFPIQGGNHAQFGDYGAQPGDNPAQIPAVDQWQKTVQATADFLRSISTP